MLGFIHPQQGVRLHMALREIFVLKSCMGIVGAVMLSIFRKQEQAAHTVKQASKNYIITAAAHESLEWFFVLFFFLPVLFVIFNCFLLDIYCVSVYKINLFGEKKSAKFISKTQG